MSTYMYIYIHNIISDFRTLKNTLYAQIILILVPFYINTDGPSQCSLVWIFGMQSAGAGWLFMWTVTGYQLQLNLLV